MTVGFMVKGTNDLKTLVRDDDGSDERARRGNLEEMMSTGLVA